MNIAVIYGNIFRILSLSSLSFDFDKFILGKNATTKTISNNPKRYTAKLYL
ncbi:MAG TPA: hypothetical protein VIK72_11050 [Clostridiaceae bacterium]